jgi:hypothetical protein
MCCPERLWESAGPDAAEMRPHLFDEPEHIQHSVHHYDALVMHGDLAL